MSKSKAVVEKTQKPEKADDLYTPGNSSGGLLETFNQPIFEAELMAAGRTIIESFAKGIFRSDRDLLDACLYIGLLKRIKRDDKIPLALMKINGTMSIGGRARNDAIQAHVGIYYPPNASKDEKKRLVEMQQRHPSWDDERKERERE